MAGIGALGGSGGLVPSRRNDVTKVGADAPDVRTSDAVNLQGVQGSDWKAINRSDISATHEVTSEQPFTEDWGRTWLNGPGSLQGGLRNINGEPLVGVASTQADPLSDGWHIAG